MVFAYFSIAYQAKKNLKLYSKLNKRINKIERYDIDESMMKFSQRPDSPFLKAYYQIMDDPGTRFWVVGDSFVQLITLNYAIYPKEIHIALETQQRLMDIILRESTEPFEHLPPPQYDKKIIIEETQREPE
jgi:hypothetical protein